MKIIYIHQYFGTRKDGHSTRSYEFARHLIERGHQVTLISASIETSMSYSPSGDKYGVYDVDGIKLVRLNDKYSTGQSIKKRMGTFLKFAWFAYRMALREKDVDLVFATTTPLTVAIPGVLAAKHHRVPFVFEVRDLWPELPIAMGLTNPMIVKPMRWLERWSYKNASWIVALAPGIRQGIIDTGFPADKVSFIPNAADTELFGPPIELNADKRVTLVFIGMHGRANGLDAVVKAANDLKNRGEKAIKFLLIGRGAEKERLMEYCRNNEITSVDFRDTIPKLELADVLKGVDAGMMILKNVPAFYNGTSPNKFFDYLAAGLPVLNNYPGWLKELIEGENCGLAVPPDDPEAFADAVVYLRDNPGQRKVMGENSRRLAETEFSRNMLASRFADVLENINSKNSFAVEKAEKYKDRIKQI